MTRVLVGGVTSNSVLLRVDDAQQDELALLLEPSHAGIVVEPRPLPLPPGELSRCAFAVSGLQPGTQYRVWATQNRTGDGASFETPPAHVTPGQPVRLGLSSCYYPSDAFALRPDAARRCWALGGYPHAVFHCGDQVYTDVPLMLGNSPAHYRARYEQAWASDRLGDLLRINGHFFMPDDHEYWNDFPRESFYLLQSGVSWATTARVAGDAFWANQGYWNFPPGIAGGDRHSRCWASANVGGVPVFLADTRTDRSLPNGKRVAARHLSGGVAPPDFPHFMSGDQFQALHTWLSGLQSYGVMIVGQPLATVNGKFLFLITDYALNAYKQQFTAMMEMIRATLARGITLIVLSGDIHWGRLVEWRRSGGGRLIEYVASPIARIGGLFSLFGRKSDGGPHKKIKSGDWKELKAVSEHMPGYETKIHFATGYNNVGSLTFEVSATGGHSVRFRSYDLETIAVARDEGPVGAAECTYVTGL